MVVVRAQTKPGKKRIKPELIRTTPSPEGHRQARRGLGVRSESRSESSRDQGDIHDHSQQPRYPRATAGGAIGAIWILYAVGSVLFRLVSSAAGGTEATAAMVDEPQEAVATATVTSGAESEVGES